MDCVCHPVIMLVFPPIDIDELLLQIGQAQGIMLYKINVLWMFAVMEL